MEPSPLFTKEWFEQQFERTQTSQPMLYHFLLGKLGSKIDRAKVFKMVTGKRLPQENEIPVVLSFFGMSESITEADIASAHNKIKKYFLVRDNIKKSETRKAKEIQEEEVSSQKEFSIPERRIFLYGAASISGEPYIRFDQPVSELICPPSLVVVVGAYAVLMPDSTMESRFSAGDTLYVDPTVMARKGLYVVIHTRSDVDGPHVRGHVRQFLHWGTEHLIVRQTNPEKEIYIATDKVDALHIVRGSFFSLS